MRDISKLPNTPVLNEEIVRIITTMLFINDTEPNTLLQIMGNIAFLPDMIKNFPAGYKNVLVSGGKNPNYKENNQEVGLVKQLYTANGNDWNDVFVKSEAEIIKSEFEKNGIDTASWKLEKESTNTKENFEKSKEAGFYDGIKKLVIYTTNESMVRAKSTAKSILKDKDISVIGYAPTIPSMGIKVDSKNWAKNPLSAQYVWGEVLRLKNYSDKGDFTLDAKTSYLMKDLLKANEK
ncbi:MAG: ElyC/SanA/YdcF family protein [Alphaproteobacteria bacterium]